MASERRQFLNKINKRIYTLTKHGVNKQDVLDMVKQNLPSGAYITEFGQINIDPNYWESNKKLITKTLDEQVKMYWDVKQEAMKPYENFIGPLPKNQADKEIQAYMKYQKEFFGMIGEYYDLVQEYESRGQAYKVHSQEMEDFLYTLQQEGSIHNQGEIPYSQRVAGMDRIRQSRGRIR